MTFRAEVHSLPGTNLVLALLILMHSTKDVASAGTRALILSDVGLDVYWPGAKTDMR